MTYFTTGLGLLYFFVLSTVCMSLIVNLKLKNMLYFFGTKLYSDLPNFVNLD